MRRIWRALAGITSLGCVLTAAPAWAVDIDSGTTGVTGVSLDSDLAMQFLWEQVGQFAPETARPASAGFALDVGGTVYGSGSVFPAVTPFVAVSEAQVGPNQIMAQADAAGGLVRITAMAIFLPGLDHVGVGYTIQHDFTVPTPFDAFVYADLNMAGSSAGIGFFDHKRHHVGGIAASGDFGVQVGALSPPNSHHYEGGAFDVRTAVEEGDTLPDRVCLGTTAPPYIGDPCYIDNAVALEWTGILQPGVDFRIETDWVLGEAAAPPQIPVEIAIDDYDALLAGFELGSDFSRGNTSAIELGVQVTNTESGETAIVYPTQPASSSSTPARVLVPASLGKTLVVQPVAKVHHTDGTSTIVAAGAPRTVYVTSPVPPPITMTAIAAYILRNSGVPVPPGTTVCGFADILGDFAEQTICWARDAGITSGVSTNLYAPAFPVSRDQMAVFLQRLLALPDGSPADAGVAFTDVPATSFAYGAIYAIAREGITAGVGAGGYDPDADVTREQMAIFLVAAYTELHGAPPAPSDSAARFTDVSDTSIAYDAIGQLYDLGVTAGLNPEGTLFGPADNVLRDQMAQFLNGVDLASSA